MFRLIYHIPIWILFLTFRVVLILIGLVVIPLAISCAAYEIRKSYFWDRQILAWRWKWMYVWANEEDGLDNMGRYMPARGLWTRIFMWSAIRNPANNLRFVPWLTCKVDPKRVQWRGGPHKHPLKYDLKPAVPEWFYAYQGPFASFWYQYEWRGHIYRIWLASAKIYPSDIFGMTEYRKHGAGMATQFCLVK